MGLVMQGDEACYRVRLAGSSDPTFLEEGAEFVYLSVITGLPVTHESAANSRSGARRITKFQDWESIGTIKLPKQLTLTEINGKVQRNRGVDFGSPTCFGRSTKCQGNHKPKPRGGL